MNKYQRMALAEQDLEVKDPAHLLDRHASHISGVLSGRYSAPDLRKKISKILRKSEDYLWPDK